jgi:RNA binding exosome subunit
MAVKFISYVESDKIGGWYIKLVDTLENNEVICKDLDEYKTKIEDMGGEYGNDIEVQWIRSKYLTPTNITELQEAMAKLQEEYQSEIDELNQQNNDNGGFNPNG